MRRLDLQVHDLLRETRQIYADDPAASAVLDSELSRMSGPLRIAIAGKVKAGKSTLVNALVGDRVAAVDARGGRGTRLPVWYEYADLPKVTAWPGDGGAGRELAVSSADGGVDQSHGDVADTMDRLVVGWPSGALRDMTFVDTPGFGSDTTWAPNRGNKTDGGAELSDGVDGVVYLVRHVHLADAAFLRSVVGTGPVAAATGLNTVAVLARADEIGGGRLDAMSSARRIARRNSVDGTLRGMCQALVPVAGLLAESASTFGNTEFTTLRALADGARDEVERQMMSIDRFVAQDDATSADLVAATRLLDRFGLFGVRLCVTLIRQGFTTAEALAAEIELRSGLVELRRVLHAYFVQRKHLLKARTGLMAIEKVVRTHPRPDAQPVVRDLERLLAGAHEFHELRLLDELHAGRAPIPEHLCGEAERLLGGTGRGAATRLGVAPGAGPEEVHAAGHAALAAWRAHAENPLFGRRATAAARLIIRTCEGLLSTVTRERGGPATESAAARST